MPGEWAGWIRAARRLAGEAMPLSSLADDRPWEPLRRFVLVSRARLALGGGTLPDSTGRALITSNEAGQAVGESAHVLMMNG